MIKLGNSNILKKHPMLFTVLEIFVLLVRTFRSNENEASLGRSLVQINDR